MAIPVTDTFRWKDESVSLGEIMESMYLPKKRFAKHVNGPWGLYSVKWIDHYTGEEGEYPIRVKKMWQKDSGNFVVKYLVSKDLRMRDETSDLITEVYRYSGWSKSLNSYKKGLGTYRYFKIID